MGKPVSVDSVYVDILNRIINVDFNPGDKISENKMSVEYGVSRSVIRHAFARLIQSNFLVVYPQRGTYIKKIDIDYIKTALIIRMAVEKEMLRRFMKQEDKKSVIEKLEYNLIKQEKFYDKTEYEQEFKDLDEEFHQCIMLSVKNKNVLGMLNEQLLHISRWRNIYIKSGYKISGLVEEHKAILNGIKSNNLEEALKCMSQHIDDEEKVVILNEEYKEFFI